MGKTYRSDSQNDRWRKAKQQKFNKKHKGKPFVFEDKHPVNNSLPDYDPVDFMK